MRAGRKTATRVLLGAIFSACALPPPAVVMTPLTSAGSSELLQLEDLHYRGAFRLPQLEMLQYGGEAAVFHDGRLLVRGRGNELFDFQVPAPVETRTYAELPQAEVASTFPSGLDDGLRLQKNPADTTVRGLLFVGPALLMTVASYYDAANLQVTSHLRRDVTGRVTAHTLNPVGHTAGFMTLASGELAPALTGNFGLPIVSRESHGPAAFVFDPDNLTKGATPVLDYPADRPLGPWNGKSDVWNSDSRLGGMHQVGRSLLFVGVHGLGPFCYGDAECGDKESSDHGTHSYPYTPRIWAYDTADLVAVKRGRKKPWEPRPYGLWNLTLPLASGRTRIASAFDPATNRLFILQGFGDKDPANGFPVVHVYGVEPR